MILAGESGRALATDGCQAATPSSLGPKSVTRDATLEGIVGFMQAKEFVRLAGLQVWQGTCNV